ncbi:MAG: hypothetical protein ACTHUO_09960, partial [Chromohalobacter japonicus]
GRVEPSGSPKRPRGRGSADIHPFMLSRWRKEYREGGQAIADKSRVILASLVGAVALAKSLPGEQERQHILEAAQRNILQMLGVDQDELDSMLGDVSQ